jgi:hypothetical protein
MMRFEPNDNAPAFGIGSGNLQGILDKQEIFFCSCPGALKAFGGIYDGNIHFSGPTDPLSNVLNRDIGFAKLGMGGEGGNFDTAVLAKIIHPERVFGH